MEAVLGEKEVLCEIEVQGPSDGGWAEPNGKENRGGGRELLAPWHGRKVEFSSPDTRLWPAVPVYLIHSALTHGVRKPPVLCIASGWVEFQKCSRSSGLLVHYNMIYIYIRIILMYLY
jgi:hypothetical protein